MQVTHLLDYGCGHNANLAKALKVDHKVTYQAYDPAVPRFAKPPMPAQMVACIDVLEHIEPALLDNVLDDIARLAEGLVFLTVTTVPAFKTLPDGRNAHLTCEPCNWWLEKFMKRWAISTVGPISEESFFVVASPLTLIEAADGTKL